MTTRTSHQLTSDQQRYLERAREAAAAADAARDLPSLAEAVGVLQWHLGEMIALVEALSGNA
jgi:hypothetical protein